MDYYEEKAKTEKAWVVAIGCICVVFILAATSCGVITKLKEEETKQACIAKVAQVQDCLPRGSSY